ncbi:hypothetical protein L1987_07468 [Smallanthus sonchifolius]|uniref:Uncharacterized protein n=1 Tax=Smallanthus sonchifolius TaxID=185202 RepID=A0ACB9K0J3_9ASTR|nr:hypothetical protein L1987_07468 [Smallanthus sonchifolius]
MGSLLACLKPICLSCNNKKKEHEGRPEQRAWHKEEKKERLMKKDKLTLQDYILSSPRSSTLPVTSSKRVYPNPQFVSDGVSKERRLLGGRLDSRIEDGHLETKIEENLLSKGERGKKRVSFRKPEIADVFILVASPTTTHESTNLQVHDHH